ncbi:MAG: glycosyl hydrolase [Bacteroidia bacterium]|nr:glycosyl hydrolase [Bacteroidia bacterium]
MIRKILFAAFVIPLCVLSQENNVKLTSSMFGSMAGRQIGPAEMSGRITCIDAVNATPRIIYVGTAGGGVWKSTTAGVTFNPISDKFSQGIGCLVIDQKNPETVYVGTGECNMRNSVGIGTGLYKTTDGGTTWLKSGLDSCERISKIIIHPTDNNTLFAAVPGALWSDSKHRGLYKSTDAGKTWTKIFYIDEKTGCADVAINPKNPDIMYMSMWQFRRTPWSFSSGGKTSALYKSIDGGKNWKKIHNGIEGEELGRICIAIAPSEPDNVYAIAESNNTGLYKSTNGGETWVRKGGSMNVTWRPFYFSVIVVDPTDAKRIYRPSLNLSFSDDSGESFDEASFAGGWVHSDHHAVWINPNNPSHLLLGTDGGVYQSLDRGNSWTMFGNLPVSMFYHVQYDMQEPYNVYGGLQDNGSWYAASQSVGGIENRDWFNCGGGDGFWVQPDLTDPNIIYSEYQGGEMSRFNKKTNESKDIKPYPLAGEPKLRCNWNTPIVNSPTNPNTFYYGAQYLFRTKNKGDSWEKISPDLSTNDKKKQEQEKSGGLSVDNSGAENHCTIYSVCESPKDENLIWVGTDDGNLQVTTDGGKTWTNVVKNIVGLPATNWVSSIEASTHDKNTAFVTFDNHATGNFKPYVFKTTDLGKTWTALATSDVVGYAHKIKQDILNSELLFLGTEIGFYVSFDAGKSWINYRAGVPLTAIRDIAIHPKTNDVILATHGRGIIILDDITYLRSINQSILQKEISFVPVKQQWMGSISYGGAFPSGGFSGDNSDGGYTFLYYLKQRVQKGKVKIEILDENKNVIKTIPASKRKGLNKVIWDMRGKPPRVATGVKVDVSGFVAPVVAEGTYYVRLTVNDKVVEEKFSMMYDPKCPHSAEDRAVARKATKEIFDMQEELAFVSEKIRDVKDNVGNRSNNNEKIKELKKNADPIIKKIDVILFTLSASIEGTNITGEEKLREKIGMMYAQISGYDGKPTDSQLERIKGLRKELEEAKAKIEAIIATDIPKYNTLLTKNKLELIKIMTREEWDVKTLKKEGKS